MASTTIKFSGTIHKIDPDYLRCIYIYLVRGSELLSGTAVQQDGAFHFSLPRAVVLANETHSLQAVVGPAGMGRQLAQLPNIIRTPINRAELREIDEFKVATHDLKLTEQVLNIWWRWCRWYCVSGVVVGPDGCPVPGGQVTVNTVGFDAWGYTRTPQV